nr:hypothetical protein BaRGS_034670 [Batillaria attramentaria]
MDWPGGPNMTQPSNHSDTDVSVTKFGPGGSAQVVSKGTLEIVTIVFVVALIPLLVLFGVVGNVSSLAVLVQHRMRSTTNMCLAALAVSDLLLLLHSLTFAVYQMYGLSDPAGAWRVRKITYPILGAYTNIVFARITTWLTTMLAVERCIAVYFPIKAKAINSRRGTLLAIILIYVVTALAFLPTFLQYKVIYVTTPQNTTKPVMTYSALGQNKAFTVPYGYVLNVLFRFIPIFVLIVVNTLIILAIRRTGVLRRNISLRDRQGGGVEQNRITKMLVAVSGVFLVCTLPGAVNTIASRSIPDYCRLCPKSNLYQAISTVTFFLETLNSSVNFVIYMVFSRNFKRTYQEMFCCQSPRWQSLASTRTVRFVPRGPSNTSLASSHEMHCMQYRPPPLVAAYPKSSGAQRLRFLANGFVQSSFDVDDVQLITNSRHNSVVTNSTGQSRSSCCSCHHGNRSRSRSRSRSQSHSSDSAANQYS